MPGRKAARSALRDGEEDEMAQQGVAVIGPGEGDTLDIIGTTMIVKAEPARGGVFLAENIIPPGAMVPPHTHAEDDEIFILLEGELTLLSPEGERHARAGDTAVLRLVSLHGFRNDGAVPVRMQIICAPGHQAAAMFRALDALCRVARPGMPEPAAVMATCARYGVTFAPPP
jgi:mannose-6-phosphate isomerase-like protein (cupin superfamily)